MNKLNVIGVDLAKNVIQVSVLSPSNRELRNSALTRRKFAEFLGRQPASLVAFEACATSHYWARVALRHGHEVKIIPAKAVFPFRQGHKTDENDALAVAEAARRPNVKLAPLKTVEQQGMQAVQRSRELLVHERVALSNHLRGLLMEFGIVIPQGFASLYRLLPEILEDGENELPDLYRPTLNLLYGRLCGLREDLERLNIEIESLVQNNPVCRRLTALEGIGPIGSVLLYATLGTGEAFANGRQFSAYLGLTPKQFSSGGKVNLVGISKRVANRRLRAVLIQGARAYVYHMKEPKTTKDRWLWAIVERSGKCKAAVALANKNVRTAWAMLTPVNRLLLEVIEPDARGETVFTVGFTFPGLDSGFRIALVAFQHFPHGPSESLPVSRIQAERPGLALEELLVLRCRHVVLEGRNQVGNGRQGGVQHIGFIIRQVGRKLLHDQFKCVVLAILHDTLGSHQALDDGLDRYTPS